MLELDLQTKIENKLTSILNEAIESGTINTETLRMVILSENHNDAFDTLEVHIENDWRKYFSKERAPIIGEIDISEWLDVAKKTLEMHQEIDEMYMDRAEEIDKKYTEKHPAITFENFEIHTEKQRAYLICLREELLMQINAAIIQVINSFSDKTFKKAVGFFTDHLTYEYDEVEYHEGGLLLHGFLQQETEGPFYSVRFMYGSKVLSNHYLCFTEKGIQLFSEGDTFKDAAVCSYDVNDFAFMYKDKNNDLFLSINGDSKHFFIKVLDSDLETFKKSSEKKYFKKLDAFLKTFPEKVLDKDAVPNPITNKDAFDKWLTFLLEKNIYMGNHDTVFDYGDDAYAYYLQSLPKETTQYERALTYHASRLFSSNRFEESLLAYQKVVKLDDIEKLKKLLSLLLLNEKERYNAYRSSIESEYNSTVLELVDTLWQLREPLNEEVLKAIEYKIKTIEISTNSIKELRLVVLIKLYSLLKDHDNMLLQLHRLTIDNKLQWMLLRYELQNADFVNQAYEKLVQQRSKEKAFREHKIPEAFNTSKNKKTQLTNTVYNDCYYLTDRIESQDCKWVHPLDAHNFLAVIEEDEVLLIRAKITAEKTIEILHKIILPSTRNVESCTYLDGIIYIADQSLGILSYAVTDTAFELSPIVYKNKNTGARYTSLCIADGYLYASNNCFLEIYDLKAPEAVLSDSLYVHFGNHLVVRDNLLVVCSSHGYVMLVDISDKSNPVLLCTLEEDETPSNMHVEFIGNYMISRSIYNIKNPASPIWINTLKEDLAPIYYFTPKPEEPIMSTADDYLFTTLKIENGQAVYTNWLKSRESEYNTNLGTRNNLATAYFDTHVISFGRYEINIWEKGTEKS